MSQIGSPGISLTPSLALESTRKSQDTFTELVYKLIDGSDLSKEELDILKQFTKSGTQTLTNSEIEQLRKFLRIDGNNTDSDGKYYDIDPTAEANSPSDLIEKQKNFRVELGAFDSRMKEIFGDFYENSLARRSLMKVRDSIPESMTVPQSQALKANVADEYGDRSINTQFDGFKDHELDLLRKGVLERIDFSSVAETATENASEMADDGINVTLPPNPSLTDWQNYLNQLHSELPPADRDGVEYLQRKMAKLEKLTDRDRETMKELLSMGDRPVEDIDGSVEKFNVMIDQLAALDDSDPRFARLSPSIQAGIQANRASVKTKDSYSEADQRTIAAASRLLDQEGDLQQNNPAILGLEKIFTATNPGLSLVSDPKKRKAFLKAYADRVLTEEQNKAIASDPTHHSKMDQEVLFEEFQEMVHYLEEYANSEYKTDRERELIQDDLIRFARGIDPNPSSRLVKAFGDKKSLLEGLRYFGESQDADGNRSGRGYGKPRFMVGMLKAIFTLPTENPDGSIHEVIDFNKLVQESNSFSDLAVKLRDEIACSKFGEGDLRIPQELLLDSEDREIIMMGSMASLEPEKTKQKDGTVVTTHNYDIFTDLGFDVSTEFDPRKTDEELGEELAKHKDLFELLSFFVDLKPEDKVNADGNATVALKKKIGGLIKLAYGEPGAGDDEFEAGPLPNGGKHLADFIRKGVRKLETEFASYDGYEADAPRTFQEIYEHRQALSEFALKNDLDLYQKDELVGFYHPNEYEDMLRDFAVSARHMRPLLESNLGIYTEPRNLKVSYQQAEQPSSSTSTTASAGSTTGTSVASADWGSFASSDLQRLSAEMTAISNLLSRSMQQMLDMIDGGFGNSNSGQAYATNGRGLWNPYSEFLGASLTQQA